MGHGASSGRGDHSTIRSFRFSLITTVCVFLPVTLLCAFVVVVLRVESPLMALVPLFFGLVFELGVLQGCFDRYEEWRARKARKRKGLPKPWFTVPDDHAYERFLAHPALHVPLTLE